MNSDEIEILLHKCLIGHLGCSDGETVYVVPISYAYDTDFVYCHTHEGRKVNILRHHPSVCFQVEHITDLANWQSVIAHGDFEEIKEPLERLNAIRKLHSRHLPFITSQTTRITDEWPFSETMLEDLGGVTFRIHLTEKTGRYEKAENAVEMFF